MHSFYQIIHKQNSESKELYNLSTLTLDSIPNEFAKIAFESEYKNSGSTSYFNNKMLKSNVRIQLRTPSGNGEGDEMSKTSQGVWALHQ